MMRETRLHQIRLSKRMSYILRHGPEKYGLILDSQGFVPLGELADALNVHVDHIREVAKTSQKLRFEISGEKIRARYGHSQGVTLQLELSEPPELLYHGTARRSVDSIQKRGLLPGGRRYVHLSLTEEQARQVGKRRDSKPAILTVRAGEANREGLDFYLSGDVYLVKVMPPQFFVTPDPDES